MSRSDLLQKAKTAADQVLRAKGHISIVDVWLAMGRLSKENYERWHFRQVPDLEKVLPGSLNEHAFLARELRTYAREVLHLKPSRTAYMSWGKGHRQPRRFSKYSAPAIEELYSTHYVSPALTDTQEARRNAIPGPVPPKASMPRSAPSTHRTETSQPLAAIPLSNLSPEPAVPVSLSNE